MGVISMLPLLGQGAWFFLFRGHERLVLHLPAQGHISPPAGRDHFNCPNHRLRHTIILWYWLVVWTNEGL